MKSVFRISKLKNVNWNATRALVNVAVLDAFGDDIIIMRDCKLIQGDFGSFVASPSAKLDKPYENKSTGKMVEYTDFIEFCKKHKDALNEAVANAYDPTQDEMKWYGEDADKYPLKPKDSIEEVELKDLTSVDIPA